jgi:hypothetical protein
VALPDDGSPIRDTGCSIYGKGRCLASDASNNRCGRWLPQSRDRWSLCGRLWPAAPISAPLKRRPVISGLFVAAVLVGTLNAIELGDAVRFALPNSATYAILFIFAAAQLAST